ncbi:Flp family type IVb pilin [Roseobacter ponti]|uniref:Flp family type IVb pilin n=1 Tax=Roseobacter ponti TaxID=1891787 RepID=UPI00146B9AFF|nr:hypothetical protein [Roseobacter ponti]
MTFALKSTFRRLVKNEFGATLVEYGIAISLAVTVGVIALGALSGAINTNLGEAEATMQ